jgi:integrase
MSRRPVQDVRFWSVQDRRGHQRTKKPYLVRWVVGGERFSESFLTRATADRYRSNLIVAHQRGEWFDPRTGEPDTWAPSTEAQQVHTWARRWVADEWQDWAPRTRTSIVESLARFIPLTVDPEAPPSPAGLRKHLTTTLPPDAEIPDAETERWLNRWVLSIGALTKELLADVDRQLGLNSAGEPYAAATAGRYRKNAKACIRRAVELDQIPADPWPPTPKGRNSRKARRKRKSVDVRRLPTPKTMAQILRAIPNKHPGSLKYQVLTAIVYYAGLRPSEAVMLRPRSLELPESGWGTIWVVEADDGFDQSADPKTGDRAVPIPPELVAMLRWWIEHHAIGPDDLMFRTRNDRRPHPSVWGRLLHKACAKIGVPRIKVYDCRHARATTWLADGVALGTVARWLGHTVETLVSTYIQALQGDDTEGRKLVDKAEAFHRTWLLTAITSPRDAPAKRGRRTSEST